MCWFFCFLITRNNIESFGSNCILHKRTVEIHRWQVWTVSTQTKLLRDTLTEYMRTLHTWTQTTRSAHTVQRLVNDLRATDANIQLMCMFVVSCVLVHIYAHLWAHAVYTHTHTERLRTESMGSARAWAGNGETFGGVRAQLILRSVARLINVAFRVVRYNGNRVGLPKHGNTLICWAHWRLRYAMDWTPNGRLLDYICIMHTLGNKTY